MQPTGQRGAELVGSRQLELEMPDQVAPATTLSLVTSPPPDSSEPFARRNLVIALIVLLIVTSIALLWPTVPDATPTPVFQTSVAEVTDVSAPALSQFPVIQPLAGPVLQVGLFGRLQGAESEQQRLATIGLLPTIRKRQSQDGIQYALVIGPIAESRYPGTVANLKENGIAYFHLDTSHLVPPTAPAYTAAARMPIMQQPPTSDAAQL